MKFMKMMSWISLSILAAGFNSPGANAAQLRCFAQANKKQVVASVVDDHGALTTGYLSGPTGSCEIDDRSELTYNYYYGKHVVIRNANCPRGLKGNLVATAVSTQANATQYAGHLFFSLPNSYSVKSFDVICVE